MLPANLSAPCPLIPAFDSTSFDDLAMAYINLTGMYGECAARLDAVVRAWPK